MEQHTYLVIDLKSFYASVECAERGLDPMTARLVVADPERTEKTICLAISDVYKRQVYEMVAEWDEEHLKENGCYGTASYVVVTE